MTVKIDIEDIGDAVQYHLDHPDVSVADYISACIRFRNLLVKAMEVSHTKQIAFVNSRGYQETPIKLEDYWI